MDRDEGLELIKRMEYIKSNPPHMYTWNPKDAWITAINACINEVRIAKNKDTKKS